MLYGRGFNMVQPHHKYAARGHKRQPLKVGDEAKDAKALAQKILENSTDMYRHVQCTDNKMIV